MEAGFIPTVATYIMSAINTMIALIVMVALFGGILVAYKVNTGKSNTTEMVYIIVGYIVAIALMLIIYGFIGGFI